MNKFDTTMRDLAAMIQVFENITESQEFIDEERVKIADALDEAWETFHDVAYAYDFDGYAEAVNKRANKEAHNRALSRLENLSGTPKVLF